MALGSPGALRAQEQRLLHVPEARALGWALDPLLHTQRVAQQHVADTLLYISYLHPLNCNCRRGTVFHLE